ncbi:hypothetical protein DSO57_1028870 [Entomophthora muscae]|uniref:Uncharacterized protein n=1 Tax=Entomophthora muscae TaxID=34485 RepID=A0ACC2RGD8_9FUNG|nr:hypothetical protein DSO57_1028870 [Entomophthora muscae]
MPSRFLTEVYPSLKIVLNTMGLTSAFVVVIVMLCLRCYYPAHVNRVSLRLQWAIAFIDVVKHTLLYFVKFDVSPTGMLDDRVLDVLPRPDLLHA